MNYDAFLENKRIKDAPTGIDPGPVCDAAFPFQADIVKWALRKGRAAIFADCGMGKTLMMLEWARQVPGRVLILTPLAVAAQTCAEARKFGIDGVAHARTGDDGASKIVVTNYDMLQHFDTSAFSGVVLDESSILKAFDGKTRSALIEAFAQTPFRLCCTATPAPNDFMELGNHAEFLGAMSYVEMLSMFFVHDGGETQKWRLKGHAEDEFWAWVCSWAVMLRRPSDLGYDDSAFILPPKTVQEIRVETHECLDGYLFPTEAQTLQERIGARRDTVAQRVAACAEIVNASERPFIVWCNLNSEADALRKAIPDAVEIRGSDAPDKKESALLDFVNGRTRVLVTKPSIAGHGMNFQHCADMAFVGLSDSYEQYYQAVRRCWRFGQTREVNVYLICADVEGAVRANLERKDAEANAMADGMLEHMRDLNAEAVHGKARRFKVEYKTERDSGALWEMRLGDCVEMVGEMESDSVGFTVYSPPFASLYTYSASDRDMGNCKGVDEFMEHYMFLIRELYRVTMPGRLVSFHCMNMPTSKTRDGFIGIRDFRGELIRAHESAGWIYHSEVCIWKDPVTAMQRTKALGLLHKQLKKDSCMSRQGIPDYLVTMRKPGDNPERVSHTNESFPVRDWQGVASPVWMDINPSDTLQFRSAREDKDERHICPLQLEVIRRALRLWSKPDDLVLSPFAGIGSEGYCAVQMGRRFLGVELKESYFRQACANLRAAESVQSGLFAGHAESGPAAASDDPEDWGER